MITATIRLLSLVVFLGQISAVALLGGQAEIPLKNWAVPPYTGTLVPQGSLTTMADISGPVAFIPINPCRVADTRGAGFTGQAGPPSLAANVQRTFQIAGTVPGVPAQCGVPTGAKAVSFQFTVVNEPTTGNLIAWPSGPPPLISVLNWIATSGPLGNGTIVPLGGNSVNLWLVQAAGTTVDMIIDVNGYFTDSYNAGLQFVATGSIGAEGVIRGTNSNTTSGSSGVYGLQTAATGAVFGVFGKSSNTSSDSAGIKGVDGTGTLTGATFFAPAGVRGESTTAYGVLGLSRFVGVRGDVLNTSGASLAEGRLGYTVSGTNYGLYSIGDIGATGTKAFVTPHPVDPSLVIRYISLEGPEAGTYFRGRGRLTNRWAVIDVPEDFRLVTEDESLSIQLTPMGRTADLCVVQLGLGQIVIQGSRDVEFFYTVNGVRKGYHDFQPITQGSEFVPQSAVARLPESLPAEAKRSLVTNGTYNPDGSINLETAQRLNWAVIWAERAVAGN